MAQAVSCRPIIAEVRVRSQVTFVLDKVTPGQFFPVAVEFSQPLTEICPRNISWCSKGGRCVGVTTLHFHAPTILKSASLNPLKHSGLEYACTGIVYL